MHSCGYYADAGLIRDKARWQGISPVQEVPAGRADFGVGNTEVLTHYAQGVAAGAGQRLPALSSIFLARRDSGILTVADMRGKRIMMFPVIRMPELLATSTIRDLRAPAHPGTHFGQHRRSDRRPNRHLQRHLSNEPFPSGRAASPVSVINPRNYGIDFYSDIPSPPRHRSGSIRERVAFSCSQPFKGWRYALTTRGAYRPVGCTEHGVNRSQAHMEYELQMSKEMIQPLYVRSGI